MNPETYPYYQCDESDEAEISFLADMEMHRRAEALIKAMRTALATVPSYCERWQELRWEREEHEMREREAGADLARMWRNHY